MTQSHSRDDQGRKEGGAADCTGGVGNALTCCAGGVGGIEADSVNVVVENIAFGVQSMEVDVEGGNAVASCCGMSDRRSMIGGRKVLLLNSSM